MASNVRTLISYNRWLSQKPLVMIFLLIVAILGIVLFSGISINLTSNNNQAQAQEQQQEIGQIKIKKLWETSAIFSCILSIIASSVNSSLSYQSSSNLLLF